MAQRLILANSMEATLQQMHHSLHARPSDESHRIRPSVHPIISSRVVSLLHFLGLPRVLASPKRRLDARHGLMPWNLLLTSFGCELVVLGCHDERK